MLTHFSDLSATWVRCSVSVDELVCGDVEVPKARHQEVFTVAVGGSVVLVGTGGSPLDWLLPPHPARAKARTVKAARRLMVTIVRSRAVDLDNELRAGRRRREGSLPVEADHPGDDALEVTRLDHVAHDRVVVDVESAQARVRLGQLVALELGGHRRAQLDDEVRGAGDRNWIARCVFSLRDALGLVGDVEARAGRLELERDVLGTVARAHGDVRQVRRLARLRRGALAGRQRRVGRRLAGYLGDRGGRLGGGGRLGVRPAAAAGEGEREDGEGGEAFHGDDRTFRSSRRSTSPRSRSTSTTLARPVWPATRRTEPRGTSSADESSSTSASFARPRSGGAATRAFHPSPC